MTILGPCVYCGAPVYTVEDHVCPGHPGGHPPKTFWKDHVPLSPVTESDVTLGVTESILAEADAIVSGERQAAYGSPRDSFARIATVWSGILGITVNGSQVALCMIGLKLCREANRPKRDNRVDIAGYAKVLDLIESAP